MNAPLPPPPQVREILSISWACFAKNWGPLFAASLVYLFITQLGITLLLIGPLTVGVFRMSLAAVRGESIHFDDLFSGFNEFGPAFVAGILLLLFGVMPWMTLALCTMTGGCLLFIEGQMPQGYAVFIGGSALALFPMCIATVLYTPTFFLLCDQRLGGAEALRASAALVRPKWRLWTGLWAALGAFHLVSSLACCVPSLIVTPWMFVAAALLYDRQTRGQAPPIPEG